MAILHRNGEMSARQEPGFSQTCLKQISPQPGITSITRQPGRESPQGKTHVGKSGGENRRTAQRLTHRGTKIRWKMII
jgi:hypothetical protein